VYEPGATAGSQLAAFEYASCQTSNGVLGVLGGVRPGMREREAVRLLGWNGMPLSCHAMLSAGPRATFGLPSPGDDGGLSRPGSQDAGVAAVRSLGGAGGTTCGATGAL
jgi:hypothetical protein